MATIAFLGKGAQLQYETAPSSGTFVTIAEVRSMSGPGFEGEEVDVTNMDSLGRFREFINGLVDPGELTFEVNYNPTYASHQQILADLRANPAPTRAMRIRFSQLTPVARLLFDGFFKSAPFTIPVDQAVTQNVTVRLTGDLDQDTE